MRTLVIGDVHGCAVELQRLLDAAGPDRVVLVGDVFTKGPDPAGVWSIVRAVGASSVLGNHDAFVLTSLKEPEPARRLPWLDALDALDPSWRDWLAALPLFLEVGPFTVVHAGLAPDGDLRATSREMAISMRRWPMNDASASRWHAEYHGDRRVLFGHDARGGLVRIERHGLPWVVGLDTGCVYGGVLSGYLVEEDRLFQVPAASVYQRVKSR